MWQQTNPPPSGLVFCLADGKNISESVAKSFFHSLPPLCPADYEIADNGQSGRNLFYVTDFNRRMDLSILGRDFVSFCPTIDIVQKNREGRFQFIRRDSRTLYVGENITISCMSSIYHFAEGMRIKSYTGYNEEHLNVSQVSIQNQMGFYNFTGTVTISSIGVRELICESFLKGSTDSVKKVLKINVRIPKNITFTGGLTQLAQWTYKGQDDFKLICQAEGDPPPDIRWKKQGRPIPSEIKEEKPDRSTSILRFPSFQKNGDFKLESFFGAYACQAYNNLDLNEKIFHVSPANDTNGPVVIDTSGNIVVPQKESDGDSTILFATIIPALILLACVIIALLMWKIKRQKKKLTALSKAEVDDFILGKPDYLQHHSSSEEVNNYAPYLPYNKSYEIGRSQLEFDEDGVLGAGAYAIVLRGTFHPRDGERVKVAVKTAKPMDDMSFFKALLSELKIMGFIGTHPNIVNLVGAHTKNIMNREVFVAIEYCANGNLLDFLRNNRTRFKNFIGANGNLEKDAITEGLDNFLSKSGTLSNLTLIKWAQDVANGMEFLSAKKVIHGDLAARNILLNEELVAKIGDFGLSRQLFEYTNYIKKQHSPLPWKYLAIECLQDMRFSVKSDVWAYAILLYEIFSLGHVPYPGYSYNDEFLDALIDGKRPNKPALASNDIYKLMEACWKERSEERPNFNHINEFFSTKLESLVPHEYLQIQKKIMMAQTPKRRTEEIGSIKREEQVSKPRFSLTMKNATVLFHKK